GPLPSQAPERCEPAGPVGDPHHSLAGSTIAPSSPSVKTPTASSGSQRDPVPRPNCPLRRPLTLPSRGGFRIGAGGDAMEPLRIGKPTRLSGCTVKAVRFYEAIGLLPRPARSPSGYRLYTEQDLVRLAFIQRAKLMGL